MNSFLESSSAANFNLSNLVAKMPNYERFERKLNADIDHILRFASDLGNGRTERRSLKAYALTKLIDKYARKYNISLENEGKF